MRKLLFTFFALILCTSLGWGANPVGYFSVEKSITTVASENSWVKPASGNNTYNTMNLDGVITFTVQDDNRNGVYRSGNCWAMYDTYAFGPFNISAASGYWIDSVALTYTPKNAHLCDVGGVEIQPKPEYASGTPFAVKANVSNKYYTSTSNASVGGRIEITNFKVVYYKVPTSITVASTTFSVGEKKTMTATVLPADAYQTLTWTSSNPSVATINETTGEVEAKAIGNSIITATSIDGKVAGKCMIAVLDGEESIDTKDFYSKITVASTTKTTTNANITDENGIVWQYRRYRKCDETKFGDEQGVELSSGTIGYLAYVNAQEGGVKSIAFQWRTVDAEKKPLFMVDASGSSFSYDLIDLTKDAAFANDQYYSKELNYTSNVYLRVRNTDKVDNSGDNSGVVFGPITITPYLFYTTKSVDIYADGDKNEDLIDNTSGEAVAYSLIGSGDSDKADINTSTGAITIKAEGTITVQASWNGGKVTTTYTATLHKSPAPVVAFTDGEAVTKSMNLETYTNALNWTSDPTKCGAVTYESDNEEVATVVKEGVNAGLVSIVGEGTANITAHIAKGSEFAAKDLTYELTVEDPNEDAIIEKFTAYKSEGWTSNVTTEAERNGDCFDWNVYLTRYKAGDDVIESERAVCFNAGGTTKDGYIVSKAAVEGGIKRIGFNWKKNGVADGTFQVIVGSNTHTINSGATTITKAAYNHNFFEKSNATLKIFNNTQSKLWVGEIKITPYLLYKKENKTPSISALEYVDVKTYKNEGLINNTNGGTIEYSITKQSPENIAAILDAHKNTGDVTIYGGGTVTVQAKWGDVTTTYTLTIEKATPTIEFSGTEIDIFGTYTPAPVAKIGENEISGAVFNYTSGETKVASVDGSTFTIKRTGTSEITATLVAGATYESVSAKANLTVNKPTTGAWEETYVNFEATTGYKTGTSFKSNGKDGVYQWQSRAYRYGSAADKVNGENGISLNRGQETNNYIAFNYQNPYKEVGGVKDIFFNWQLLGTTNRTAKFNILMDTYNEDVTVENAVANDYYSCAKHVNCKGDAMLKLSIPSGGDSIVFGPITIIPYLLYTTKTDDINVADYVGKDPYKNNDLINNTDEGSITYSIKSQEPAGIASIADATKGDVTILGAGTVVVKATWSEGASTTYTLNIARTDLDPATLSFQQAGPLALNIDDAPFTNELTGVPATGCGDVKYSTNKPSVAMVNENTGEVTIKGAGDATITATVLQGTIYNQVTKIYQISVNGASENKTITETFKAYKTEGWTTASTDVITKEGDYFQWDVYKARHDKDRDSLFNKSRATWLNSQGYIRTTDTLQGGIKRISFKWNKVNEGSVRALFSLFWTEDNSGYDQVDVNPVETGEKETLHNPDFEYSHNFFLKRNVPLRIVNSKNNAVLELGEITITPYIYFPKRCDTIVAEEYIGKKGYAPLETYDNTNNEGTITYSSDNTEIAEVALYTGIVTVKAASATPVKITMTWQPLGQVEKVTASYLLYVSDKADRQAEFAHEDLTVARGEVINDVNNKLTIHTVSGDVPASPNYTLESADTCVAKVVNGEVHAIAPGNTVITAHIEATSKCKALDISYTLHVTYQPTGQYWYETLKNIQGGVSSAATETVTGEDGIANKWKVTNVYHKDQINGKTSTRVRYSSSIATNEGVTLEGGIKEVLFSWRVVDNSFPTHFTVTAGTTPYEYRHGILASEDDVQPFAHDFNVKSNATLSISNAAQEATQQSHIIIDTIKVVPYLLYTTKTVELSGLEHAVDSKYTNESIVNNTGVEIEEGQTAIIFSIKDQSAETDKIAVIDAATGEVTLKGVGTVTVQATWEEVVTTYDLTITMPNPVISGLEATAIDLDGGSYTPTINVTIGGETISERELTYSSSNTDVAVVNSGTYTPVSVGTSNMKVTLEAGTYKGYAYSSVNTGNKKLTVNGYSPAVGKYFTESFTNLNAGEKSDTTIQGDNKVYSWNVHNFSKSGDVIIKNTADDEGYIAMNGTQEGGIKYVSFGWATENPENDKACGFVIGMNDDKYTYHFNSAGKTEGYTFGRMFNQKTNSAFSITVEEGSTKNIVVKTPITVVPYLLYTTKEYKLNMNLSTTYKNEELIDNRDDEAIEYKSGDETIATVADDGTVTALTPGVVTITAKWGDVSTSYELTIIAGKTTITLSDNYEGGSEQVIENTINAQMEAEVVIPTRTGYRFNAYFYDAAAAKGGNRMTATNPSGVTSWVNAVRTYSNVTYINNRVWVYEGAECTIYANWMPERKIALDNQDETTPDTVYTAICANNDAENLKTPVTVPVKENQFFLGYYTEAEGGTQIVDENGAFKASVEGYTDEKTKWQKDVEITTLYAHWVPNVITLDEGENNSALIAQVAEAGLPTKVNTSRTITAGMYNTFCLPFNVDAAMLVQKFGSDYELAEFTGATLNGEKTVVTINFMRAHAMVAGKPYLIKTSENVANPSFDGVTIVNSTDTTFGEGIVMKAVMNPTHITPGDHTHMIVVADDNMAWLQQGDGTSMKGMRAYFHVVDGSMQAALRKASPRLVVGSINTPTELMQNAQCTMQGVQKVLINEQIYIIRNGVHYNVNGQMIK